MQQQPADTAALRARAERVIAIAQATGAKAHASADFRMVFVERRDGTREAVRIGPPAH